mmetsp:Transcript_2881/g.8661  ORF Transcript_2881/g.8661 Transcript_2881/m.8661 type:complete len:330 (-) Transcript_2881:960-1949(-)
MRVPFKRQDVRGDAVEEEAVVRHDQHRTGETQDRLLQRAQRADVQVVRGLVEDEDVAALPHDRSQLRPVPLAPRKIFDLLRLLAGPEAKGRYICARVHLALAQVQRLALAADGLEDGLAALGVEVFARLVHRRQLDGPSHLHFPRGDGLLAREHFDECGLPRAVRADDADDGRPRHLEAQVVDEDAVADLLPQALGDDDLLAETGPRRDPDRARADGGVVRRPRGVDERIIRFEPRLCFRAGLGRPQPLELLVRSFRRGVGGALALRSSNGFRGEPLPIRTFEGQALAIVQFQDPLRDVLQKITVVRHRYHCPLKLRQISLQPQHRLRV